MTKPTLQMYGAKNIPTWCPGCGDFQIWMAIKKALVNLEIMPEDVLFVFDVGCNGNMSDKIGGYRFHSLHGRPIPVAAGAAVANKNIKIIAFGGDGGTYGEGVNHFVHAVRSNYDMTMIVHNNGNYGLTTGQATPTTEKGRKMNSSPDGVVEDRLNPVDFSFSLGTTFIAREFTNDVNALVNVFEAAISHKGFSHLDIIQDCPTYDRDKSFHTYLAARKHINDIEGYDNTNKLASRMICLDQEKNGIPVGVLYQDKNSIPYYDRLVHRQGVGTQIAHEVKKYDVSEFLAHYR